MHTEGPWAYSVFEEFPDERGGYFVYAPGVRHCITKLATSGAYRDYDHKQSEAHDNARLISAAPELLSACKKALTLIENGGGGGDSASGDLETLHTQLLEAVSKATGVTRIRSIRHSQG